MSLSEFDVATQWLDLNDLNGFKFDVCSSGSESSDR